MLREDAASKSIADHYKQFSLQTIWIHSIIRWEIDLLWQEIRFRSKYIVKKKLNI